MPLVQGAHRRHQADHAALAAGGRERVTQLLNGAQRVHARREVGFGGLIDFGPVPFGYRRDQRICSVVLSSGPSRARPGDGLGQMIPTRQASRKEVARGGAGGRYQASM